MALSLAALQSIHVPIRWKLVIAIAAPTLVVAAVVASINYPRLLRSAQQEALSRAESRADYFASIIEGRLRAVEAAVRTLALEMRTQPDMPPDRVLQLLEGIVLNDDLVFGSCMAYEPGPDGVGPLAPYVKRWQGGTRLMDVAEIYEYSSGEWEWYEAPRRTGQPLWTEPFFDQGAGDVYMCTYAVPVLVDGRLHCVATADIAIEELQRRIRLPDAEGASYLILSRDGDYVSHPLRSYVMRANALVQARALKDDELVGMVERAVAGKRGQGRVSGLRTPGETDLVFYRPIAGTGWSFVVAESEDAVFAPVRRSLARFAAVALCGLFAIVVIIFASTRHLTRPIVRLNEAVRRLGAGDLTARTDVVATGDEVGELGAAFNAMVEQLTAHIDALTRETAAREAVEGEVRVARAIQTALLPRTFPPFPHRHEFELHALNLPARHIAGDFYDFFFLDDRRLMFVIADVSGKGAPAALLMAVTRTIIRNLARVHDDPGEILAQANKLLLDDAVDGMFVTMFLGEFDVTSGVIRYANAGHPPPLCLRANGKVERFGQVTAAVLAVLKDYPKCFEEATLAPGETLVLFTDGFTEARAEGGELLGERRVAELLRKLGGRPVLELCEAAAAEARSYQNGQLQDDLTILAVRRVEVSA